MGRNRHWQHKVAQTKHQTHVDNVESKAHFLVTRPRKADLYAELAEAVRNTAALQNETQE